MRKIKQFGCIIILILISNLLFSQTGMFQWRPHLSYLQGEKVIATKSKIYMSIGAALLEVQLSNSESNKLTKINGLSDSYIKSLAYNSDYDYLLIGYGNGNLDILRGNEIINISDIKRKSLNADKSINSIVFSGDNAYLGCGFGIVVLDLIKKEIKETWFIGDNGSYLFINSLDIADGYIYAATEKGVYKGDLKNTLVDFSRWEIISDNYGSSNFQWMPGKSYKNLVCFGDKVILNYYAAEPGYDTILVYNGERWDYFTDPTIHEVYSISCDDDRMYLCKYGYVKLFDKDLNLVEGKNEIWEYNYYNENFTPLPSMAISDPNNRNVIWIADKENGLVAYYLDSWGTGMYRINGPDSNNIFDMDVVGDNLYGVMGAYTISYYPSSWLKMMAYKFSDETWKTFSGKNTSAFSNDGSLVRITVDPNDPSHFFCGSWLTGLYEFRNDQFYKLYNEENSTLKKVPGNDGYIRIGGMRFDDMGNLWVTNSLTSPAIHVLTPEGDWHSFNYSSVILPNMNVSKFIITKDNVKWIILPRGNGLFIFDDNGTLDDKSDDKHRLLIIYNDEGERASNDVYSIAEDKNGYIWVGTSKGIIVYQNPEDVFSSSTFLGRRVKIPRNDGTDIADILLENETVTTINVDGANKKWFGTSNSGVYYTSEDGIEEYYHFTTDNSPLLDNSILCAAIAEKSGEVFFGTSQGILSFRNVATEGSTNYTDVYVFPNPVREDYEGPVTITGLVENSYVKITDISGNMVYEVRSDGGQAIWDGKDARGNRVKTGIYLVFSTSNDGAKTDVTKIMFIN